MTAALRSLPGQRPVDSLVSPPTGPIARSPRSPTPRGGCGGRAGRRRR